MIPDVLLRWSFSSDGWPVLQDKSLARWLRGQAQRQAERGVQLSTQSERVARLRALGLTVAGTLATTPAAPLGAIVGLLSIVSGSVSGGLDAYNDADRDGRPDDRFAPSPEADVQRFIQYRTMPFPAGAGQTVNDALEDAIRTKGYDVVVWWLLHAARVFGEDSTRGIMIPPWGRLREPAPQQQQHPSQQPSAGGRLTKPT